VFLPTVTVSYGGGVNSKTISFSASGLPSGASASFSPSSVTVSPSSSTASSTMTISTSTSTPTGTYTITITGSGGGVSKTTQYSLTVTLLTYAVNFYVYDDAGNAVSGATINFGGSSYSHGGSTSVPPASYSLSTGTIPGGYRFKQWETSGGVSVSSSTSSSTTATVGGSGTIIMRLQRLATVTFSASGLGSDASGTILTVDGNSYSYSQLPVSFTWDVGSSHSFSWNSPISAGSGKRYAWTSTSGLSTSQSGSISVPSGGGSVSASYRTQYYLTVSSAYDSPTPSSGWFDAGSSVTASVTSPVSGGSGIQYVCTGWSGSGSVPSSGSSSSVTFTINAPSSITWNWKTQYYLTMQVSPSGSGTVTPSSGWYDSGSSVQISASPSSNYRFDHWTGSGTGSYSGTSNPATVTMNGPITETAYFAQTGSVTFSVSGIGSDASGTLLTVDGVSYSYSQLPLTFVWDVGSSHNFAWSSPVSAGSGKQYAWVSTSGLSTSQSGTITVPSGGGSVSASYKTQYYLTMQVGGGSGSVSPSSGWFDSGAQVQISATPSTNYRFDHWTGSGSGSYSGSNNPATITMNGPIAESAYFVQTATVTFSASGLSSDASGTILTVDGVSYSYSQLPKSFTWDVGSSHSFSWSSPVSAGSGKQYVWTSCSGLSTSQSGSITVPSGGGSITASYKTQYYLTMQVGGGSGSVSPSSGWYDAGASVSISATASSGYAFDQWIGSGSGSYTGTSASASVTMNAPITETAYFFTFSISISPNSGSVVAGGSVSATVTVSYGSGYNSKSISFSASGLPSGASASFNPSSVTISPSSTSASSTITISTSSSTSSGTFSITVTGSGGGVSKQTTYSLSVYYSVSLYIYDDAGNTVSSASLNFAGSSYSSGASVNVFSGSYSLSTGTIPGGYRFKQWEVSGGVSVSSSTSSSTTATVSGSGTIIMRLQRLATVTFSTSGLSSDASGTILTVDGVSYSYSSLPKSFTWDVGSSHSFSWSSPVSAGSGKQYVWTSTSGISTSQSGSVTVPAGGGSVSASYKTQYYLTVNSAYDSPNPSSGWFDAGSSITASVTSPVSGGSGIQYVCTGWSGTGSVPSSGSSTSVQFTINAPSSITWNWKTQYYLTVSSAYDSPSPSSGWFDAGTSITASVASPVSGGTGIQYVCTGWSGSGSVPSSGSGTSTTFTINAPSSITWNWKTQYYLTMQVGSGSGTVSPSSGWYDSGVQVQISASPSSGYRFGSWSGSGSGSYSGTNNPATVTMNGPITETANFIQIATVTFSVSGMSSDASGTVLTVDGVSYSYSSLPKSFTWDVGSSHSFSWSSPVSAGSGKQYVWTSTSGLSTSQSGSITVPSNGGSVTASYKTQYYLTVNSAYDSPTPTSGWFDAGTSITASVSSPVSGGSGIQYVCTGWTGSGSVPSSGSGTSTTFTINAPSSITWNWKTQYYLTVSSAYDSPTPSSGWYDAGTVITSSVTSPVSGGTGIQYVCTGWSGSGSVPSSGSSTSVQFTINAPSSITWNWKTQYYLTMQVGSGSGSLSPSSGWYDAGSSIQITATPSIGYGFVSWAGSGSGSYTGYSNPASITMNAPITETASFNSWLTGWQYRKRHVINPASGAGTNYPVHITVYYGSGTDNGENVYLNGRCKSDFTDIRFTKSDGSTLLSYWMESVSSGNYATFWVQVSDDLNTNPATIYIYYGNPSASRADDPQNIDLWQLREHQTMSTYYPNIAFTKTDSTTIRIDSNTGGANSLGEGDIFIIVPRDWLNGKKVQINWNGYFSYAQAREIANVVVLNTELNRKQSLATNWIDAIYTNVKLVSYTSSGSSGWTGWQTTTSGTISISSFSNKYVTLVIRCADAWAGHTVMLDVNWIKILDSNNNVLKTYDFTNSVVMEVTGTYEDYGLYRKYVSPEPSHGGWGSEEASVVGWLSGWPYRNYHIINGVSTQLTDYQVRITVYYGSGTSSGDTVYLNGLCKSDFSDLRFTGPDGVTLLPYWIEYYTASNYAYVWVKIPSIPASGSTIFYLYYGNPSASSASDGASTFLFFDDFLGTSLDTSKWDVRTTSGGTYSVSGGILTITVQSDGVNWKEVTLRSYTTLPSKCEIRAKVKWTYASEHESWIMNYYTDPSNLQAMGYRGYYNNYVLRTVISGQIYDRTYSMENDNPSGYEWWSLSYDGTTLVFKRTTAVSGPWTTLQSTTSNIITSGYTVGIRDAVKGSTASYFYIDYIFARNLNNPEPSHGAWG
jgi:hypothetical protein